MCFASFCGVLTLQVGLAVLASAFWTVANLSFLVNLFDSEYLPEDPWPVSLLIVTLCSISMLVTGGFMLLAAYCQSHALCVTSLVLLVLLGVYWGTLCVFSFLGDPHELKRVCIKRRCAESFWLIPLEREPSLDDPGAPLRFVDGIPLGGAVSILSMNVLFVLGSFVTVCAYGFELLEGLRASQKE